MKKSIIKIIAILSFNVSVYANTESTWADSIFSHSYDKSAEGVVEYNRNLVNNIEKIPVSLPPLALKRRVLAGIAWAVPVLTTGLMVTAIAGLGGKDYQNIFDGNYPNFDKKKVLTWATVAATVVAGSIVPLSLHKKNYKYDKARNKIISHNKLIDKLQKAYNENTIIV